MYVVINYSKTFALLRTFENILTIKENKIQFYLLSMEIQVFVLIFQQQFKFFKKKKLI